MVDRTRWIVGGLLVLLGLVLLGDNLGLYGTIDAGTVLPALVILWGLWSLVRHRLRRLFWPLLLVLVGVLWQLVELGVLTSGEAWDYWPAVLVLLGLSMLFRRRRRSIAEVSGDSVEFVSVRRSIEESLGESVSAGDATAVFGNVTVDLRDEAVDPPVELDAVAIFGDVTVRVPPDWDVATESVSIFGRVVDQRADRPARSATPDAVVSGVAVFGDVVVTD